mmetsp:Transcript_8437/g.12074  ORF Transcript_8437/g.12074 Transcript_8437/m.12074 type:complete len:114 (+) Transcript_8437:100-441(+)
MMFRQLLLLSFVYTSQAFVRPLLHHAPLLAHTSVEKNPLAHASASPTVLYERRDASRSGTKRDRLDKLAELEEQRIETDKGFVVKAAGGFVGLILVLLVVAFATGLFDVSTGY